MCLSLIKIRNNSRHYKRGFLPLYNEVPCGRCPECVSAIQRDWFIRVYYECLHTEKVGGQTFFLTMTYNNDNIPQLDWTDKDIDVCNTWLNGALCADDYEYCNAIHNYQDAYGSVFSFLPPSMPCFSRKHLSMFLKSLRQILHQENIYTYEQQKQNPLKYFISSEYGSDYHRSHYHGLFFVPFQIGEQKWLDLCARAWSYQIYIEDFPYRKLLPILEKGSYTRLDFSGKKWFNYHYSRTKTGRYILKCQRGNVSYSDKNPAIVRAGKGISYVSKYVHKTDEYTSTPEFDMIRSYLKCFMSPSACKEFALPLLAESVQKLKDCLPFVHSSQNLGACIVDVLENKYGNDLAQYLGERCLDVRGSDKLYKVPNYIINRIMYRKDLFDNSLRVLTETGVKVMYYRYLDKVDFLSKSYKDIVGLAFHLDKKVLSAVFDHYNGMSQDEWFNFLRGNLFGDVSRNLAIYSICYRNVSVDNPELFTDISLLVDTSVDAFMARFALPLDTDLNPKCQYLRAFQLELKNSYNFCPCFDRFEIWLTIWTELNRIVRQKKVQDKFKEKQKDLQNKKYITDLKYSL